MRYIGDEETVAFEHCTFHQELIVDVCEWLLLSIVAKTAIAASTTMSDIALQYPSQVINQQTLSAAAVSAS